jgi:hypothetical protein
MHPGHVLPPGREGIEDAIAHAVESPALRELVVVFGGEPPTATDVADQLDALAAFSSQWDYRSGGERNLGDGRAIDRETADKVARAARALGLSGTPPPAREAYDHVIVLGGLASSSLARLRYAARLLFRCCLKTRFVDALTTHRELKGNEVELVRSVLGDTPVSEFDVMDAGVRNAFGLEEPSDERGEESDAVGASWRVREYVAAGGLPVRVIAASSRELGRRANTADTYAWIGSELAHLQSGERLLLVTSDIYVPYQHADALRMLALPYGVAVETVGMRLGEVDPRLAQEFQPYHYLQEIRSTILALRNLHSALAVEGRPL